MELILLIGLQATGKSSFYKEQFFRSHVRINLDMLKTRRREGALFEACLKSKTRVVVDNTNLTRDDRARYIVPAREEGFKVIGYFFQSKVADAMRRNADRSEEERVPDIAIAGASNRMELPGPEEGFHELFFVRLTGKNQFEVQKWRAPMPEDPDDDYAPLDEGKFPWEEVDAARRDAGLQRKHPSAEGHTRYLPAAKPCPTCQKAAADLAWLYFESPEWTWEALAGRAGWMTVCDNCHEQVDFFLEILN